MIKSKKIAGLFLALTITGSSAVFAESVQVPQELQQQTTEVSDEQLSKFADAFIGLQSISQNAQQQMSQVVEQEGMEIQRFNEVHQASLEPQSGIEVSEKEKEQHGKIIAEVEKLQVNVQQEMEKTIAEKGLSMEEYQAIATALQTDTALQERLRATLQQ